jgi:hypothetical protein
LLAHGPATALEGSHAAPVSWPRPRPLPRREADQIHVAHALFLMAAFTWPRSLARDPHTQGRGITCAPWPVRVGDLPDPGPPRAPSSAADDSPHLSPSATSSVAPSPTRCGAPGPSPATPPRR